MTALDFSNKFDVLYNNITSNQAPGLDEFEKSTFLTKAQDEIIKNYFLKQSNPKQAGFDDNQKRQADFANIMGTKNVTSDFDDPKYVFQDNSKSYSIGEGVFLIVNERIKVTRAGSNTFLTVKPISYEEFDRLTQKPYKYPTHYQAWRLMVEDNKTVDLVVGPTDTITEYHVRYIKTPHPIIVGPITPLKINGWEYLEANSEDVTDFSTTPTYSVGAFVKKDGKIYKCTATHTGAWNGDHFTLVINDLSKVVYADAPCELDEILHEEILQRAVELAKVAWTANGQDNAQLVIQTGARSE